jgi:hypothetical protein
LGCRSCCITLQIIFLNDPSLILRKFAPEPEFHPYYFRNDYAGFEQNAVEDKKIDSLMIRGQREFSEMWSRNLIAQGFIEAYQTQKSSL